MALALPRGVAAVVGMWAIAKTGAAFVPVDPTHPGERIGYLLAIPEPYSGCRRNRDRGGAAGLGRVGVPGRPAAPAGGEFHAGGGGSAVPGVCHLHLRHHRATQGRAGHPHRSGRVTAGLDLGTDTSSRVLRLASATFDASVFEMLHAFAAGATLVIAPPEVIGGDELTDLLRRERVTHALIPPAILATVGEDLPDLRTLIVGGDVCPPDVVTRFGPRTRFHNAYGPSEATVITTITAPFDDPGAITLGDLLPGFTALVLDTRGYGLSHPAWWASSTSPAPPWRAAITAAPG